MQKQPQRSEISVRTILIVFVLLASSTLIHAFDEPDGFKDYKFGMTTAEITAVRQRNGRGTGGLNVKESLGEVVVDTGFFLLGQVYVVVSCTAAGED
jgi:hypothetical protein